MKEEIFMPETENKINTNRMRKTTPFNRRRLVTVDGRSNGKKEKKFKYKDDCYNPRMR